MSDNSEQQQADATISAPTLEYMVDAGAGGVCRAIYSHKDATLSALKDICEAHSKIASAIDGLGYDIRRIGDALVNGAVTPEPINGEPVKDEAPVVWPAGPRVVGAVLAESGLTPPALCRVLGVAPSTMYKWLAGIHKPKGKGGKRLFAMAASYGIEVNNG